VLKILIAFVMSFLESKFIHNFNSVFRGSREIHVCFSKVILTFEMINKKCVFSSTPKNKLQKIAFLELTKKQRKKQFQKSQIGHFI
jgi:thiamine kinase-like enzyme